MKRRGLMKMCSLLCLAGLLALAAAAGPCLAENQTFPYQPYILKAKLKVNGTAVTGVNSAYTVAVTDTSGNALVDPTSGSTGYGGVVSGEFYYQIPMTAANTPSAACIAVSLNGTPLYLTYPAQGVCIPGSAALTGLSWGDSIGFGGINGEPNDGLHTFATPLTAVTEGQPTVDVQCKLNGVLQERNATTAEYVGSIALGQTVNDTGCVIKNAVANSDLTITALTVSGCGFSLASPLQTALPLSIANGTPLALNLALAPCGTGGIQTGALTIASNDPVNPSYAVALTGNGLATINLIAGWNLIGLPVTPSNSVTLLTKILGTAILPYVSVVWAYTNTNNNGQWSYYDPNDKAGSALTTLTSGNGYWIYMTAAQTLTIH